MFDNSLANATQAHGCFFIESLPDLYPAFTSVCDSLRVVQSDVSPVLLQAIGGLSIDGMHLDAVRRLHRTVRGRALVFSSAHNSLLKGNTMTKIAYAAFAAILATITYSAVADEMKMKGGEMGMMNMNMMDTNKDGMISEDEHMKVFTTMDKNKDGMVDTREQKMMMSEEEGFITRGR